MRIRTLFVTLMVITSCLVPTVEHTLGLADGGVTDASVRCVQVVGFDVVCATLTPVVCGGVSCAAGEVCCQTTGACVAPGSPACPKSPTIWPNGTACGSSADCASDEYCMSDDYRPPSGGPQVQRCIGTSGHCQPITNCASCGGPSDRCQVCGCNGVTYASPQEACVAGVWAANQGACGRPNGFDAGAFTVACGTAAQCPAGAQCCFRTGKCFDASEPWRCEVQPNGSVLNCASHGECNPGFGGGSGSEQPTRLCAADGCGGPGLCSNRTSPSDCGGQVQSVCGCDGLTYVNACWARAAGVRVASTAACP